MASAMFDGHYGQVPASLVVAIAGQVELGRSNWAKHEPWIRRVVLDVFSEEESRNYLAEHGIPSSAVVSEVLRLSGRLPVLLAALAAATPNTESEIGDITGTAVDVFLKWITDPVQRHVAISGALPRTLNEDSLAVVGYALGR